MDVDVDVDEDQDEDEDEDEDEDQDQDGRIHAGVVATPSEAGVARPSEA